MDEYELLQDVLDVCGAKQISKSFERRFVAKFGISYNIFTDLWDKVRCTRKPLHLLLALNFLKEYNTENAMAVDFQCDEKTIRLYIQTYVPLIASQDLIRMGDRFHGAPQGSTVFMSLDGTHCPIKEPFRPLDTSYYSHKLHRAALVYEVGLSIYNYKMVWVAGGVGAGCGDLELARESGVLNFIEANELVAADKGYNDDDTYFMTAITGCELSNEEKRYNTMLRKYLARHEIVNKRLKHFHVLTTVFRHDIEFHSTCFKACAMLTQLSLSRQPLHSID